MDTSIEVLAKAAEEDARAQISDIAWWFMQHMPDDFLRVPDETTAAMTIRVLESLQAQVAEFKSFAGAAERSQCG